MSEKDKDKELKQGQDTKITKTARDDKKDFKASGIEGEKGDDGSLSVRQAADLREENARLKTENAELKTKNAEIEKDAEIKKDYVTGEDVLKTLREKGHKV